ncbi:MAG: S8 family serine peptidase, partial [Candidatus Woesearchaeota archaeon]
RLNKNYLIAEIDKKDYEILINNSFVEEINYNPKLSKLLIDSTKLIYADSFWNLSFNENEINGSSQSVCVIDTGIDFSHLAFGNCYVNYFNNTGNNVSYVLESNHPYSNNLKQKFKINYSGFEKIAVFFSNISLEQDWDFLKILDSENRTIATYTGYHKNVWTPSINGDTIYILLESDEAITDFGFIVSEIKNGTTNNTLNWSCEKIIAGWDYVNNDALPFDDEGHGTHVSGIIASQSTYLGVAKGSKIVSVKAADSNGDSSALLVANGIEYCTENKDKYNISVISISLGTSAYNNYCDNNFLWFSEIVQKAVDKNISIVIASGNSGNSNGIAFPACLKNVTSVGSVSKTRNISSFSQSSLILDLLAYGSNIVSAKLNGGFISYSGTSMATPHVSGSLLLINDFLKKENRTLKPDQIENLLKNKSILILDSRNNLTFPLVNLSDVLKELSLTPSLYFIQEINNSNLSLNYTYIEFYFSEDVKNVSIVFANEKINISFRNNSLINNSINSSDIKSVIYYYNFTNLTDKSYNFTITCYDFTNNYFDSGLFYFYIDTIKPKSIEQINYTLNIDGSVILYWKNISLDINNNSEKKVKYIIYRQAINNSNNTTTEDLKNLSKYFFVEEIEFNNLSELIYNNTDSVYNYTDSNISEGNYSYLILTKDSSNNVNESIFLFSLINESEKKAFNQINVSSFCNNSFSDWSEFSSCIDGISFRQREKICYNKTIIERENITCSVSNKKSGSSSSRSGISSATSNYNTYENKEKSKKTIIVKNTTIKFDELFSNLDFNFSKENFPVYMIRFQDLTNYKNKDNKSYDLIVELEILDLEKNRTELKNNINKYQKESLNKIKIYSIINISLKPISISIKNLTSKYRELNSEIYFFVNKTFLIKNNLTENEISLFKLKNNQEAIDININNQINNSINKNLNSNINKNEIIELIKLKTEKIEINELKEMFAQNNSKINNSEIISSFIFYKAKNNNYSIFIIAGQKNKNETEKEILNNEKIEYEENNQYIKESINKKKENPSLKIQEDNIIKEENINKDNKIETIFKDIKFIFTFLTIIIIFGLSIIFLKYYDQKKPIKDKKNKRTK